MRRERRRDKSDSTVVQICIYATLAETLDASIRPNWIDRAGLADPDRLGYVTIKKELLSELGEQARSIVQMP